MPTIPRHLGELTGARVTNSVAIPTVTGVVKTLTFDTVRRDTGGFYAAAQPTRLTAPHVGWYLACASVAFEVVFAGLRVLRFRVNGATLIGPFSMPTTAAIADIAISIAVPWYCAAGDYVEAQVFQDSGGPLNVTKNAEYSPEFSLLFLGA